MDSLHFTFRAAGLTLLLPLAGVCLTAAPAAAQVLDANYETGTTNSGISTLRLHGCCSHSHSAASNASRTGSYSLKSYLKFGDPQVFEGPRAETSGINHAATRYNHGDSVYYGFSIYVLSSLEEDSDKEDILFQWKARPDGCDTVDPPHMFLAIKRSEFVLRINYDVNECSTDSTIIKPQYFLSNIVRGRWNDFVVQVDWTYHGDGRVRVWFKSNTQSNYALVLDRTGANMTNDVEDGFLKWGIYKPSWKSGPTAVTERQFWHDNVRVGSTFAQVDPSLP